MQINGIERIRALGIEPRHGSEDRSGEAVSVLTVEPHSLTRQPLSLNSTSDEAQLLTVNNG
jgi:hypothetical protein